MPETQHVTQQTLQQIHSLGQEQVPDFIANRQRAKALSPLIKQLNNTLLSGRAEQKEGARIALEKLGFTDV